MSQHSCIERWLGRRALLGLAVSTATSIVHAQTVTITTPAPGMIVAPGQTVSVSVTATGAVAAVQVAGEDLGVTAFQTAAPYTFTIAIPAGIVGQKNLTAIAVVGPEQIVVSTPVPLDIEPSAQIAQLSSSIGEIDFGFIGDQVPVRYRATFADGSTSDVTRSTQIRYSSGDPNVATVDAKGTITAVASGKTTVSATYGIQTAVTRVLVPPYVKGDLDGDGRVTASDMLVLRASLGATPTSSSDARDLNGDGVIDAKDLEVLATLCGAACAAVGSAFNIASTPGSATLAAGQQAVFQITLEPQPGFSGTISMSCSGLPAQATCTFTPATVAISQVPASVQLAITTSKAAVRSDKGADLIAPLVAATALLPIGLLAVRRRPRSGGRKALLAGFLLALSACGGGGGHGAGTSNPGNPPPPAASRYTVTITASAGSVTQSTSVALIVT